VKGRAPRTTPRLACSVSPPLPDNQSSARFTPRTARLTSDKVTLPFDRESSRKVETVPLRLLSYACKSLAELMCPPTASACRQTLSKRWAIIRQRPPIRPPFKPLPVPLAPHASEQCSSGPAPAAVATTRLKTRRLPDVWFSGTPLAHIPTSLFTSLLARKREVGRGGRGAGRIIKRRRDGAITDGVGWKGEALASAHNPQDETGAGLGQLRSERDPCAIRERSGSGLSDPDV